MSSTRYFELDSSFRDRRLFKDQWDFQVGINKISAFDALEAKRIGLVSDVFKKTELIEKTMKFAEKINRNSPFSSKMIIEAVNKGVHLDLREALEIESQYFKKVFENENKNIGIESFLSKKNPEFID